MQGQSWDHQHFRQENYPLLSAHASYVGLTFFHCSQEGLHPSPAAVRPKSSRAALAPSLFLLAVVLNEIQAQKHHCHLARFESLSAGGGLASLNSVVKQRCVC